MTTFFEIPLSPTPQRFRITLAGVNYGLVMSYRAAPCGMGGWCMDINDDLGNPIVCGVPLVTGSDLLAQYAYLGLGGGMMVLSDGDADALPTFENLGITPGSHLYWITTTP